MATTVDFIEFVCEQIHCNFSVRYKKMFGEYMVYVNDKPILLVCDNCVYVKKYRKLKICSAMRRRVYRMTAQKNIIF